MVHFILEDIRTQKRQLRTLQNNRVSDAIYNIDIRRSLAYVKFIGRWKLEEFDVGSDQNMYILLVDNNTLLKKKKESLFLSYGRCADVYFRW